MSRRYAWAAAALLAAGCKVGPSTTVHPVEAAALRPAPVPAAQTAYLDSLSARNALPAAPPTVPFAIQGSAELQWLAVLRDTVLVSLVRQALVNSRDVQIATARVAEYRATFGAARGDLFPQVSANGVALTNRVATGLLAPVTYDAFRATADVQWELDFWGRLRRQTEAAQYDLSGREDDRRAVLLSLVSDVATAYLELRELDEDVRIAEATLGSRQNTLRLARQRFTQGLISELDVRQFESDAGVAAARLADFGRQRAQKENQISALIGQPPGPIPRGALLSEVVQAAALPDSLSSLLLARRPDVLRAQSDWSASLARVGVSVANRLPKISITAAYGRQSNTTAQLFGGNAEIYTLQAGVSVPLFTGGRLSGQQRAAAARADQGRARYEQTVLGALREASDAMAGLRFIRDQLSAQEAQVRSLRRAYDLVQQRYGAGVSSYLEVLDVERTLFASELAMVQTQRLYLAATVQLYKAVGGSWTLDADGMPRP